MVTLYDVYIYGKSDTFKCSICNMTCDLKHLLYECTLSKDVWMFVQNISGLRMTYRKIVLGYNGGDIHTEFLNYFTSLITYTLYKCYLIELKEGTQRNYENIVHTLKYDINVRKNVHFKNRWNMINW